MESSLRQLQTQEDYEACVVLQRHTWGEHFHECVPPAILQISQKIGGVTAGAFNKENELVGFVFGLTGVKQDKLVHWSHMLAVRKECQGSGIGIKLKFFQRELLIPLGVETVYWTFDPLVARNAHLNLNRLGARISEYVPDMYGDDTGSDLHRGIGMDRFIIAWPITEQRVRQAVSGKLEIEDSRFLDAPVANTKTSGAGVPIPIELRLHAPQTVRVEVPADIESIQSESVDLAAQWRANTRRVFLWYLERGYTIETLFRDPESGRCYYGLAS